MNDTCAKLVAGPNDYVVGREAMKSGSFDAQSRRYHKHVDVGGRVWLVADQANAADNVYVHDPRDKNSNGFGGSTLRFPLVDGGVYEGKGPWHSNSDALFSATGVDVRETCLTFVVLSRERDYQWPNCVMRDVVYRDANWTLGRYKRYEELIAAHPEAKFYYAASQGGSSMGPI